MKAENPDFAVPLAVKLAGERIKSPSCKGMLQTVIESLILTSIIFNIENEDQLEEYCT